MRALTLHRPWPWAILHLDPRRAKRIENRTRRPPASLIGQFIAIHAGLKFDDECLELLVRAARRRPPPESEHPTGIVGVARLVGYRTPSDRGRRNRWYWGKFGWLLDDVHVLAAPVACRGWQGFWTVPDDIARRVREQLPPEVAACV